MSCNGCRVLRKGCSEECMLRHCLQGIESPQAQAHATVFVAKFFGRAALMSFISSVPIHQRSALFRSLLYEAVGRTINPVNGAVGLLWTGNWHLCQLGVEKVLRGGALSPLSDFSGQRPVAAAEDDGFGSVLDCSSQRDNKDAGSRNLNRKVPCDDVVRENIQARDDRFKYSLGLGRSDSPAKAVNGGSGGGGGGGGGGWGYEDNRRAATPSEESETTTLGSSVVQAQGGSTERKLLRLFF